MYIPVTADDAAGFTDWSRVEGLHEAQLEATQTATNEAIAILTNECSDAGPTLAMLTAYTHTPDLAQMVIWIVEQETLYFKNWSFRYCARVLAYICEVEATCGASEHTQAIHDAIATVIEVLDDLLPTHTCKKYDRSSIDKTPRNLTKPANDDCEIWAYGPTPLWGSNMWGK